MTVRINEPLRTDMIGTAGFDTFNNGTLAIYSGSQPAGANAAPTGDLLAEITLPADAFGAAGAGAIAKAGTWEDASADDTGVAGYGRLKEASDDDSLDGDFNRMDFSISESGGGGDAIISNTDIAAGQTVTVDSFTVTMPAS